MNTHDSTPQTKYFTDDSIQYIFEKFKDVSAFAISCSYEQNPFVIHLIFKLSREYVIPVSNKLENELKTELENTGHTVAVFYRDRSPSSLLFNIAVRIEVVK